MSTKTKSGKKETLDHVVKARATELEYYRIMEICRRLKMTPSSLIRFLLKHGEIHATVYENRVNDQMLTLLNQIITEEQGRLCPVALYERREKEGCLLS